MSVETRVGQLLNEIFESGRTPEEVCADCPELLPEVRKRSQQMRLLKAELSAMFPTPLPERDADTPAPLNPAAELPNIPGYQVEAVVGRGGMGIVYKAQHLRLNRPVALKMLLAGAYAGLQERERFIREAESVASLRHANLVQVYDVGEHDGRPYFTMEYVEGGSLAQKLLGTPQPIRQAAALVATLAEAVEVAHQGGIIHRDLKPGNILLQSKSQIRNPNSPKETHQVSDFEFRISDFDPKVADFGLARHFEGESVLTLSGTRVGTPSYMAPEQAMGKTHGIGPAADIYSLGAVLYELITGRPPFKGETPTETQLQVIHHDPVSPSRLNPRVPRDLETICLKCLQKDPARRYATAAALADDLRRFGEGRPIQARPVGWVERSWRWSRRNPTAAALLLTALAFVGLASGGAVWFVQQRDRHDAELRRDIDTAVTQAERLRLGFRFDDARQLLEQARQRLASGGPDDLRRLVEQARADLELVERLDDARSLGNARSLGATLLTGKLDLSGAEPLYASAYASAFAEAELGREGDDVEAVASRVRDSEVHAELVAALDDWASITPDLRRRDWLLAVARAADGDSARNRLRQLDLWQDGARLTRIVQEPGGTEVSPLLATALARVAGEFGADAMPLLTAVQEQFPHDFWLNFELGDTLVEARRYDEAVAYFRAALALRPQVSVAHNGLGNALYLSGRPEEAVRHFHQALGIDPRSALAHVNLAMVMVDKGRLDEAIDHYQHALTIAPRYALAHMNLGLALGDKGRLEEGFDHLQQAVRIAPRDALAHYNLGRALRDKGQLDEAISHYQEAIRIDPKASASVHNSLGLALWSKGRHDEAISRYQEAIRIDPKASAAAHYNLGLALRDKSRPEEAIDHLRQTIELEPTSTLAPPALASALFQAARADALAAADQGSKAGQLSESERADKRRQALARLRANLELRTKLQNEGKAVAWSVAVWQTDPALAGVREPAALAKLPDAERAEWQRLWANVAAIIATDPRVQGEAFGARRDWAKAADGYAKALKRVPTDDGHFWFEYAALLLLSGDRAGYEKACAHMIETYGKPGGPRSFHLARACTLAPDAVADGALPGRLAETELQRSAKQFWSLTEQGALAYRAGRYQETVALFEQRLKADHMPGRAVLNWLWLALANQRLEKSEEARRWLNKAQAWLDQYRDGMPARADEELGLHLHNWLEAHVLRREAEALIQSTGSRGKTDSPLK
jgi:serine/threonine-protein kinase